MTRVALALAGIVFAGGAWSCTPEFSGAPLAESARYTVAWRVKPAPIVVGRHFNVEFVVCPKAGGVLPADVRVDAQMPDHRHGMNYKAVIKPEGQGRFRAEGLMFHMLGRWELMFELRGAATERLVAEVMLK